jgi:flagellar protein FlbD
VTSERAANGPPSLVPAQVLEPPVDHRVVIRLHRLGKPDEEFHLNPDLIAWVETTPDTIVTLTTHTKLIVAERPAEIAAAVRAWRASILEAALPRRPRSSSSADLALVRGTAGEVPFDPQAGR